MVKYAFGFPVVAMVSHIPVKSHMAVTYIRPPYDIPSSSIFVARLFGFFPTLEYFLIIVIIGI